MVRRIGALMLDSLYISTFVTFVLVASAYSGWQALEGPWLPWVGALLTTLPAALFVVPIAGIRSRIG